MEYPKDYINQIICGDCLEVMKGIPDKSVDLVVTDPPYGIDFKRGYKNNSETIIGDTGFEVMVFLDDILMEFKRILKTNSAIYWFTRFDVYPYLFIKFRRYFKVKNQIIWYKKTEATGLGDLRGNYANNYESILFAVKDKHILKEKRCGSVWSIKSCKNEFHFTQKPLEVIYKIINYSSNKEDIVLDPFLGSGTTAVACKELWRRYIGIEISPEYCEIARRRLNAIPELLFK